MSAKLLDYDVLAIIGTGTFGTCFRVRSRITGKLFVWKAIDYGRLPPESAALTQLVREINVLKQLAHPNIVRYFNHIAPPDSTMLYIIMEDCEGGDLAALIARCRRQRQRFEESFVWRCAVQLCRAVQGCHSFSSQLTILHRDIKPANVFLDAVGNVKLGDFGLARMLGTEAGGEYAQTQVGTAYYQSPEVVRGAKYGGKSDIWSLGCLVYELCALRPPFDGAEVRMLRRNILDGRFARIPAAYSGDLQRIISQMLSVEDADRPTVEMMLHHPQVVARMAGVEIAFPRLVDDDSRSAEMVTAAAASWFTPQPDLSSTKIADDRTEELRRKLFDSHFSDEPRGTEAEYSADDGTRSEPGRSASHKTLAEPLKKCVSDGGPIGGNRAANQRAEFRDPRDITQEVFTEAFRRRLQAIRHREQELKAHEADLRRREQVVQLREKRVLRKVPRPVSMASADSKPTAKPAARPMAYDDSCLSVEPNDATIVVPTVAKFDAEQFRRPKAFTLKAAPRFINLETPGNHPLPPPLPARNRPPPTGYSQQDLVAAVSNALGAQAERADGKEVKKSLLSRLQRNFKSTKKPVVTEINVDMPPTAEQPATVPQANVATEVDIPAKWTDETKRTAFAMLAAMNASNQRRPLHEIGQQKQQISEQLAVGDRTIVDEVLVNDRLVRHDRKRQSMMVVMSLQRPGLENHQPWPVTQL